MPKDTIWMLESVALTPDNYSMTASVKKAHEAWGLTALFEAPQTAAKGHIFYIPTYRVSPPKIVDVSDVFQESTEGDTGKSTPVSDIPVESVHSNKQQIEVQSRSKPTDKDVKVSSRLPLITSITFQFIYKLKCNACDKVYVGQSGRAIGVRFKEHIRYIKSKNSTSAYATHILENRHEYRTKENMLQLFKAF